MAKYPPYVNAYGKVPDVFDKIITASVPAKFTNDFLYSVLGLKSSSYRAMIPLLKKLDFLDVANIPTESYKQYRDPKMSGYILADKVKEAYSDLYSAAEYAHKLEKEELTDKLITLLGVAKDDNNVPAVIGTFLELVKISDFEKKKSLPKKREKIEDKKENGEGITNPPPIENNETVFQKKFGISYTINLNLPATTEIEVYNSIFRALKENLLDG